MAVVSFTTDITRQNDFETAASLSSIGGGPGAALLSAIVYEGTQAVGRRVNSANTDHGYTDTEATTRDTTTAAFRTYGFKGYIGDYTNLNAAGLRCRLGSAGTAYHLWVVGDDGTIATPGYVYPSTGGYVIQFIDATLRAWLYETTGNPDETAIDEYTITANISATSNGENLWLDCLDWIENGFYLVGGDGADTDGNFLDFVEQDEDSVSTTADRAGLWQTRAGIIFFYGSNTVGANSSGTAIATEFTDSFKTLVSPGGFVREGFNSLNFDLTNASTTVTLNNITIIGQGRSGVKNLFDAAADPTGDVNTGTNAITASNHQLNTGDQILYSQESGTGTVVSLTGGESELVTSTTGPYYYAVKVDDDIFQVATTFQNAQAGTTTTLTAGVGIHSFTRTPDIRPDFIVTGAESSGSMSITDCTLQGLRNLELSYNTTITRGSLVSCQKLTMNSGSLSNVSIVEPTLWSGEAFISSSDITNISDCAFSSTGFGHAIEIDTTGTYTFSANTFSGYGPDNATFSTDTSGIDAGTDTITTDEAHSFTDGDRVYYSDEGGVASIGLTDQAVYYVNAITTTTLSLHATFYDAANNLNRENLSTSGAETHALYSAEAAIFNNSGGAVTINITNDGSTPSIRNGANSSTTVNNTKTLTITNIYPDSEVRLFNRNDTTIEYAGSESVVGELQSATITNGGSGYSVSDVLTITGGTFTTAAQVTVDSVDGGGAITAVSITTVGSYTSPPDSINSPSGGLGSNAVLTIDISGTFTFNYNYTTDIPLTIVIFNLVRKDLRLNTVSLINSNQSIPIQQIVDRNYSNP